MWTIVAISLYIVLGVAIVISLLLHGAKPSKTLAWLLAIFTIPLGGMLLYIVLGRNRRKNKLLRRKKELFPRPPRPLSHGISWEKSNYVRMMKLVQKNCHFPPTSNNRLLVLKDGKTTFEAIFEALEHAQESIHLQYYIFEEGELADRLLNLFQRKISRNVKVRMIYDGIGSFSLSKSYLKKLHAIGVEVYPFLPFRFGRFLVSLNYRNHRKIIVIDDKVAFTGGINISDKYLKGDPLLGNWHDMHLRIEGSAAAQLNYVFAMDWYLVSEKPIPLTVPTKFGVGSEAKKSVQIVYGGPDDDFPILEQAYLGIIHSAKKYLYVINPYVIPGQAILQALLMAALSGVDVRILLSEKSDSKIVNWSIRSYFGSLLKSGIKIYLFHDGFLHSKIMVSDDAISTIGTANFDDRSFEHNYEVNAIIYDRDFAKLLKQDFLKDINVSRMLSYAEHKDRFWTKRLQEGFGRVMSPLL